MQYKGFKNYRIGYRRELMKLTLVCGSLPFKSLSLLDKNLRGMQRALTTMEREGTLEEYHEKDIWVVGISDYKKKIGELIEFYNVKLLKYYELYGISDFTRAKSGTQQEKQRVLRNSESILFMYAANCEVFPGEKESINQSACITNTTYYTSREIKASKELKENGGLVVEEDDTNIVSNTRINGLLASKGGTYAVYNLGKTLYKFRGKAERKTQDYITRLVAQKSLAQLEGAVLMCKDNALFTRLLFPKDREEKKATDVIMSSYPAVYHLPFDVNGVKTMEIMSQYRWKDIMLHSLLTNTQLSNGGQGRFYDGKENDNYYLIFCIPDLKKLKMFVESARMDANDNSKYYIYAYNHQIEYLSQIPCDKIYLKALDISELYSHLVPHKETEDM